MQKGYAGASALRKNMGEKLLEEAQRVLDIMPRFAEGVRAAQYDKVKATLELAAKYDPENKVVAEKLAAIDKEKAAAQEAVEKERDERQWPGNYKAFAGPGDVDELLAAARKFLINSPEWGGNEKNPCEIVAVAIKGDWWSVEKNILGETKVWGLPVYVAVAGKKGDPRNVTVLSLSLTTTDNKKEPPFNGATVGDSFIMRRKNIPGGGGSLSLIHI